MTLQVNQATTTTTLTAVNATTAGSVTLSAIASSINGGAVTGSVQFLDGSTSLSAVTVNSTGLATYSVQLSNGPHTLTAVYSGDVNNLGSTSTALLQSVTGGLDFSLSANPKMLTLSAGQSMPVSLAVFSSDGFTGTVTFKCTGLPNGSTCSFNPASITGNATSTAQTTTLTIGLPDSDGFRCSGAGKWAAGGILHAALRFAGHLSPEAAPAAATHARHVDFGGGVLHQRCDWLRGGVIQSAFQLAGGKFQFGGEL